MATGQFIQVTSLFIPNGPIVLYGLDDTGSIWKLVDQPGQKWILMRNERQ